MESKYSTLTYAKLYIIKIDKKLTESGSIPKNTVITGTVQTISNKKYVKITSGAYKNKLILLSDVTAKTSNSSNAPSSPQSKSDAYTKTDNVRVFSSADSKTNTDKDIIAYIPKDQNLTVQKVTNSYGEIRYFVWTPSKYNGYIEGKNIAFGKKEVKKSTPAAADSKSNSTYYIKIETKLYNDSDFKNPTGDTIAQNIVVTGEYFAGKAFRIKTPTKYKDKFVVSSAITTKAITNTIPGTDSSLEKYNKESNGSSQSKKEKVSSESNSINTSSDGTTSIFEQTTQEKLYMDDNFTVLYGDSSLDDVKYRSNIDGLQIKDIRGILGCPHQYMAIADMRIDGTKNEYCIGRLYAERIIKHMPLLLITPGIPTLLTSASNSQKSSIIKALLGVGIKSDLEGLFSKCSGKYYSLKYAYTEYFYYLNAMLRAAAYFLNIQNKKIDGKILSTYNWMNYTTDPNNSGSDIFGHTGIRKILGPYAGCIAMYADCGNNVDDSFNNNTSQSNLSSMVNGVSDQAREVNFMIGNIGGMLGLQLGRLTSMENLDSNISEFSGLVDNIVGHKNGFISRVVGQVQTLLAGGRMVFPEIWTDSSFSRSYNCKMKLVSPSGDKLSIFLNILVPIYHLLALTLPRQGSGQTYYSPFLVRAYCKSLFNVDMGIITDLSITKGEEGEWTKDGLPTVADVSFTIKDLYDDLFMSKYENPLSPTGIMSNIAELDYIANSCGVNINDQEIIRTAKMYVGLGLGTVKDQIDIGIFGNISQYFNQKLNNLFGVF